MKCAEFLTIPTELRLQIIRKCYPIPYVRLRRSCRFLDEFCEKNRKQLGIYCYRKDPHLYLLNAFSICPFRQTSSQAMDEINAYLLINYAQKCRDVNFMVPMTEGNIPRIRESLSGFAFTHVTVENMADPDDSTEKYKKFEEAVCLFLEVARDFPVRHLALHTVLGERARELADTWKVESIDIFSFYNEIQGIMDLDSVKRVPSISYRYYQCSSNEQADERSIRETARGRQYVRLEDRTLTADVVWNALNSIYENWNKEIDVPDTMSIKFSEEERYIELDLPQIYGHLLPRGTVYLGQITKFFKKMMIFADNETVHTLTYDIWIIKTRSSQHWRILSIIRNFMEASFLVQKARSREELVERLLEFIPNVYTRIPLDLSVPHELMSNRMENLEEIQQQFSNVVAPFKELCSDDMVALFTRE